MKDVFVEHCYIFLNFLKLLWSSKHDMNAVHGQKGDRVASSVRFPRVPLLSRHVCPLPSFVSPQVFSPPHSFALTRRGSRPVFSLLAVSHPTFLSQGSPRQHTEDALSAVGVPLLPIFLGTPSLHPVAVHRGQLPSRPQTQPDATRTPKHQVTFTQGLKLAMGCSWGPRAPTA